MIHSVLNLLIKKYIIDIDIVELSEKYNIYCKQHGRDVICAIFGRDGSSAYIFMCAIFYSYSD